MLQDLEVYLVLVDVEIQKTSVFDGVLTFGSPIQVSNYGTAQAKGIISSIILCYNENFRGSCEVQVLMQHPRHFCSKTGQEEMKATITGATYNPEYNFNMLSIMK